MVGCGWVTEAGLLLDIFGAIILTSGLLIGQEKALELGVAVYADETDEGNLKLPQVRDRLAQAFRAKMGLALLVLGFVGQAVGSWPT
jgi:hypothetical protein